MPNFHGFLPNGKVSISYSTNDFEGWDKSFRDKYFYRPIYIEADLMALSPFTRKDCAGVTNGSAYLDDCQECVGGTTGKTACVTDPAIFYPDCNFGGNAVALGVGQYNLRLLKAAGINDNDIASVKVKEGYKVDLYTADSYTGDKLTLTADSSCLDDAAFTDLTTSISISRFGTDTIANGKFYLVNKENGLYLDSDDGQAFTSDRLVQTLNISGTPLPSQAFDIVNLTDGFYQILASDGRAVQYGSGTIGSFFELKNSLPTSAYQTYAIKVVDGLTVKIYLKKFDVLMEGVPGINTNAYTRTWEDEDQVSGLWELVPVPANALDNNKTQDGIYVSPNPVHGIMNIQGIDGNASIQLINVQGQVVLNQASYNGPVDVSYLPTGVYILKVSQNDQVKTLKVLIN
jgi:hypothetical protein